jgi:DNA-binding transcriptional ArsR family regulator
MIKHSEHVKGVVAALFGYHQMTTGMLAAHIGYPAPAISAVLKPMYEAGLIERGRFMVDQWQGKLDYLYRLRADEPLERWLANLDEPDWCAVTLGMEPKEPARFVRHNLLVSELVLRLHETAAAPLQTIYGERLASNRRLLPKVPSRRDLSGDACVVREDGLRIVIELVQNQRDNDVMEKMTAWGKVLSQGSLNALGTVVVFLNACGPTVSDTDAPHVEKATSLRRCHLRALTPENLGTNKEGAARARMAIYVAAWRDWFPGDSCISTDFTHLRVCWSPDGSTWTRAAHELQGLLVEVRGRALGRVVDPRGGPFALAPGPFRAVQRWVLPHVGHPVLVGPGIAELAPLPGRHRPMAVDREVRCTLGLAVLVGIGHELGHGLGRGRVPKPILR